MKPGYKQTDVGVIPEAWEVRPLLTTVRIANGQVSPKIEPYKSMILVAPDHIERSTGRLLARKTAAEQRAISGKYVFDFGDVVYSKIRPYLRKAILANFAGLCSADMYPLKPASDVSAGFMLAVVLGYRFSKYAESVSVRSGMPKINRSEMAEFALGLPPLSEQRAIATILSDVDALLGALDRLIAKKRDLKQAAMQQLLTGQTRLPGFHGEWEVKTLTEVCWFQEGPGVRNTQFTASGVKLLNGTNIFRGALNLDTTSRFISEQEAHGAYAHFLAGEGDIVLASSGITIERLHEKVAFVRAQDLPFCMNTSTIRFKPSAGVLDPTFLFQFLASDGFKRPIGGQATGSAQLNFGPSHVAKVYISLPPLDEQTAIAAVLSDMDAELTALEQRREKTRALKQGMMQELLTGRIRLVEPRRTARGAAC